ncbi:YfiR family protein [Burkholderia ambifaria]|uniref:YfiR family protein n=1 Tax=Burkholderia ambifaria TaxID=152480 RepID=UPI00158D0015|nr:YfiR family protein [Burkholderia ambifaria]ELK6205635.1 YfiR family protein [Burkholderia ambifaria]WDR87351.1 YfiR family protein [Burkholderia ambifaria]WDS00048.1 YfiR family protein [Burkholderia ambifaria]
MDASVCAAAASHAAVSTPVRAAAIAAHTASGRPGRVATLRRAFVAIVCVLSGAPAVLAGASADTEEPTETVRIAAPAPAVTPANPAISSHDSTVRQVVLGIVSFTRWPSTPVRLHLCVTGRPDYAAGLTDTLQAGSTVLDVQRVRFDDPALGLACDVVYLGTLGDDQRARVRAALAGRPVLTIAEHDESCTAGAMFCLTVDGERVTFDINLDAVARSGLRVHPNVLNLARRPLTP